MDIQGRSRFSQTIQSRWRWWGALGLVVVALALSAAAPLAAAPGRLAGHHAAVVMACPIYQGIYQGPRTARPTRCGPPVRGG
jgi:hypothetical protein